MGATIDYGILLTNNYIENRKTMNKHDAIKNAFLSSITTILTSGSILVLATLIIGLVSKVSIISDLGLLLSRGCLISVLMIIIVLPQTLLLCDKIIEKTSINTKFYDDKEYIRVKTKTIESK
jgi:predicted RND superfamily exporter protein